MVQAHHDELRVQVIAMAERFIVSYALDEKATDKRVFKRKGPTFAFGKRKARTNFGLCIEVSQVASVPEREAKRGDVRLEGRYWRPTMRWDIYPDGSVNSVRLSEAR